MTEGREARRRTGSEGVWNEEEKRRSALTSGRNDEKEAENRQEPGWWERGRKQTGTICPTNKVKNWRWMEQGREPDEKEIKGR